MVSSFQPGLHPSGTPDSNYAVWSTVYACLRKGCLPGCLTHRRIYSVFCKSKGLERRARAVLNGGSLQVHKPRIAAAERAITGYRDTDQYGATPRATIQGNFEAISRAELLRATESNRG